jgi:hypothetical protein
MYTLSNMPGDEMFATIREHWTRVVEDLALTGSDRYLHHRGRPLVAFWGLGWRDVPIDFDVTPEQAQELLDWFREGAPPHLRATVLGGLPAGWATLRGSSLSDPAWADVFRSFDVVVPWAVGQFDDDAGIARYRSEVIELGLAEAHEAGMDYGQNLFAGLSNFNVGGDPLNQFPRRGGGFYWTQVYNALDAGATILVTSTFDKVDNGTAIFRVAPTASELPTEGTFLTLDADGEAIPGDFYLRLAGEAGRALRGEVTLSPRRPIDP